MEHKNKKKAFLAVATSLIPIATTLLSNGKFVHGGIVSAIVVGLFIGYDHFDDKAKGAPKLPEGIDAELIEQLSGNLADEINKQREKR